MRAEIPQTEIENEIDYQRWLFEMMRAEWEKEQQQEGGGSDE